MNKNLIKNIKNRIRGVVNPVRKGGRFNSVTLSEKRGGLYSFSNGVKKHYPLFILGLMLLIGIVFSVIQISRASPAAPNPGHSWNQLECDTNLCVNTGTGRVGIGPTVPAQKLDVAGTVQMTGFKLTTAPTNGYVLTSDAAGVGTWQVSAGGGYTTIQDEGGALTQRTTLNFTGAGVACADNAGLSRTDCTIPGGGVSNSISQLDSNVTVTDAGDGYITFTEDGSETMRITGGNVNIITGNLNMGSNIITNLAAPVGGNDAARKAEVDAVIPSGSEFLIGVVPLINVVVVNTGSDGYVDVFDDSSPPNQGMLVLGGYAAPSGYTTRYSLVVMGGTNSGASGFARLWNDGVGAFGEIGPFALYYTERRSSLFTGLNLGNALRVQIKETSTGTFWVKYAGLHIYAVKN